MRKIFSFLTAILFAGSMMATDVAVTIHASSGDYYAKTHEWQNATQYDQVVLDEVITANRIGTGNNGKYYSDWRFYTSGSDAGSFSIDAAAGYELQSVTFTYTTSNSGALYMGETKLASNTAAEVSGQKAVFQCKNTNTSTNGQVRLTKIAVPYTAPSGGGDTPAGDTYTVAGSPAAVFGEAWNPALAANDMVKQTDGTYKWEKTDLTLGASTVEFKVVTNHSWDNASYPASNYQLAIAEAGKYTISITFEPANENKVSAVATKSGDAVVDPTAAVRGQFNGWDGGAMTLSAGKESASATVAIAAAGNYEFKMVINDGWRGNGYTFHRDFTSVSGLESNGDNMVLTADVAGDYIFTWTFATNTMEITFPAKEEPAKETLNAFPAGKTDFTTYAWGEDVAKNKVIFDDNNYIMMYSQGNPLVINANYGLQIGNSSKVSAFVFRVGETTDITVDLARNGSDVAVTLYYMGATVDTLTSANLTTAGVECAVATISEEASAAQLVKKDAAAGYYKVVSTLRFCVPAITLGKAPVVETAKYYLTGDSALVVDAGLAAEKAWDPMAIKSETDTFALSLKANQEYKLKLIEDGDWKGGKVYGYDALTVKADGLSADADGNIVFKLNTASAVQVVYFWEEVATDDWKMTFKLLGDFYVAPEPPVVEHTYTVAGGSDIAFGTTWNPANTDNDMVKQEDGTYKWEKTELTLPAGAIEFKVCEDHAWTTSWPAQNYNLAIAEAGIYTITITFNPAAEENKVAAVATKTGSAVVDPTVSVKGSWDGWANELKFTLADNKETATLTVENIKAGTYEFKVILNGSDWRSNGYEYNREFTGAEGITGNDSNNMKIVADVDGTYSFTWTFATNALNITFPKTGTGIDNTADGIKAVKVIRDGQLLIIKGDKTFNIQGQLVK